MKHDEERPGQACVRPIPLPGGTQLLGYSLAALSPGRDLARLPYSVRILAENLLRNLGVNGVGQRDLEALLQWHPDLEKPVEVPFHPARVLMQDYTGIPALVDLAALRHGMHDAGGDPQEVNPQIPVDLIIDHSMVVDHSGHPDALTRNMQLEFVRNAERFRLARWAQAAFDKVRVVPPGNGILHQVNIEYLALVVRTEPSGDGRMAYPDTMVGTDSHSTMVNGLGVLGWGVGGIEAEAAMMGLPLVTPLHRVVGVRLTGRLRGGVTATDLVLTLTQRLRAAGVVDAMVEFCGPALDDIPVPDRATIANMGPEFGSTCAFFPIDAATTAYLSLTGRSDAQVALVEAYARFQGLWRDAASPQPAYSDLVELDLSEVQPCVAGPGKPQQRVALGDVASLQEGGQRPWQEARLSDGAVVIAAITSCTNTSNPGLMIAAGLLARNAVRRGMQSRNWVKTSLTPGSRAVGEYLAAAGLLQPLQQLGFHIAGYGCGTCGGNSGPLDPAIEAAILDEKLQVCSVLSGNRNFEARIHLLVRSNYLMSPPLVIAYAMAGHMGVDLAADPIGADGDGRPVYLHEIWPGASEVQEMVARHVTPSAFGQGYADVFQGDAAWQALAAPVAQLFPWDEGSSYIRRPPYLQLQRIGSGQESAAGGIRGARALLVLGDGITTDHISPAGVIADGTPAAQYLQSQGVARADYNAYGARRSNHEVMVRGTFASTRLRNELVPGVEGGVTRFFGDAQILSVHEAAQRYAAQQIPVVVIAGKDYGAGSSRDWAAKGTRLLGVEVVIAESYERIHRANLANLGVLPLQWPAGYGRHTLALDGGETLDIDTSRVEPGTPITVIIRRADGARVYIDCRCRLDTTSEVAVWQAGGMFPFVLHRLLRRGEARV